MRADLETTCNLFNARSGDISGVRLAPPRRARLEPAGIDIDIDIDIPIMRRILFQALVAPANDAP